MRRIAIALVAAAALSACATYSERQDQAPWLTVKSTKPVREFEGCAIPKIRDLWPAMTAGADGDRTVYIVPITGYRGTVATITLVPDNGGTRAEIRSAVQGGHIGRAAEFLRGCV